MKRDMTLYKYCDIYFLLNDASNEFVNSVKMRAETLGMEKIFRARNSPKPKQTATHRLAQKNSFLKKTRLYGNLPCIIFPTEKQGNIFSPVAPHIKIAWVVRLLYFVVIQTQIITILPPSVSLTSRERNSLSVCFAEREICLFIIPTIWKCFSAQVNFPTAVL